MPQTTVRQELLSSVRSMVVKIGTNVVTRDDGQLDKPAVRRLADQIAELRRRGLHVTVVSSGAIGAGVSQLRLGVRPKNMALLQAAAAVGQPALMNIFDAALSRHRLRAAQMLLTRADFEDRRRYLNVRNTLGALHQFGTVPIVNENDTVAVDEIRYGDNDILAALVTNLLRADLLVMLTVVDGLIRNGEVVELVERIDESIRRAATPATSALGTGGMDTKLRAAKMVTDAGEAVLIANGRTRNILPRLLAGALLGTLFVPTRAKMTSRKRWIALAVRPAGQVVVDDGAAAALRQGGKSLLPIGVIAVRGRFERGEVVRVVDATGQPIAQGMVNYGVADLRKIKGLRSDQLAQAVGGACRDEVIHRNNLVLIAGGQ